MADESTSERVLRLRADVDAGVQQLSRLVGQLSEETGFAEKNVNGLSRSLAKFEGAARSVSSIKSPASNWTPEFQKARTELDALSRQYQQFRQASAAGIHVFADPTQGLTSGDRTRLIGLNDAANASVVTALRQQESAFRAAENSATSYDQHLPRLRYALYDVATSATFTGIALTGVSVATAAVAIKMQRDFADVQRTTGATGQSAEQLRAQFQDLFTSMPTSWSDLTDIGALAGQLGIAKGSVAEFTKLVAQFAATTDVSVNDSATAFGRLAQLLKVPAAEYENMGSSILAVGTSSVATESQIIAISKEIASIASVAGFSADQVFGLSAALASLGTQPELARGLTTRLFGNISSAVSSGGARLQAFAKVAGETADQFAKDWGQNASGALVKLMDGLSGLDSSSAYQVLSKLGITAARDIPAILRLAQNTDVLKQSLDVAGQGYADGTEMAKQYNVITSTVAEKLNVLVNNFQQLVASVGGSANALGGIVDVAIAFVHVLSDIASNPALQWVGGLTLVITALLGVFLLSIGAAARFSASILAMRTAMNDMGVAAGTSALNVSTLATAILGTGKAAERTTVLMRGLGFAMKAASIAGIALLIPDLLNWLQDITKASGDAAVNVDELQKSFAKLSDGDTAQALSGIEEQIRRIGALNHGTTSFWDGNQSTWYDPALIKKGFSVADLELQQGNARLAQTMAKGAFDLRTIGAGALNGIFDSSIAEVKNADKAFAAAWASATTATQQQKLLDYYNQLKESAISSAEAQGSSAKDAANAWNTNMALSVEAIKGGVDAQQLLSEQSQQTAQDVSDTISSFTDVANAALNVQDAVFSLGQSLGENGTMFDYFSEAGRSNMGALIAVVNAVAKQTPGDAAATAANLNALFQMITQGAGVSASRLDFLRQMISGLAAQAGVAVSALPAPTFDPSSYQTFFGGIQSGSEQAAKAMDRNLSGAAKKAQKEVRTLVDYANDLNGVFGRSFDLRFGSQQGLDAITKGWRDVADATRQAKQDIADYQAKLAQLTADRSTKQYQLGVAIKYRDFKRAAELRADLADNNNDITKTQQDLSKAQDASSKSLTGNSDAAIKNRDTLLSLVGSYQDLIQKYASSGLSQADLKRKTDQLKQSFIQQATQLGFNRSEVQKYASSFDDIATIISRVPRNITVTANANPALQALAEFESKAKSTAASAQRALSGVKFPQPKVDGDKWRRMVELQGQISRANTVYQRYIASGSDNKAAAQLAYIRSLTNKLSSGNYWTGGYTGGGGRYDPAGIVHKNEYVMNSSTVNRFGVGFLDMIQKGKLPFAFAPSGATGSVVNLSPIDRALIQRVGDLIAAQPGLGAGTLVGAVNAGNSFANSLGGY